MHAKSFIALVLAAATAFAAPIIEEIEARRNCADVAVFFARGTTEPGTLGTLGSRLLLPSGYGRSASPASTTPPLSQVSSREEMQEALERWPTV